VILFTLAGVAVYKLFHVDAAFPIGVFLGLLVAPLVPVGGTACGVPPPAEEPDE